MEKFHPYLYLGFIPGFGEYPNILYSWVAMALLITVSLLATRALETIPAGPQNLLEALFDLVADFMEGTLGPEGKPYFPLVLPWAPTSTSTT